jgi:hypothetical protein
VVRNCWRHEVRTPSSTAQGRRRLVDGEALGLVQGPGVGVPQVVARRQVAVTVTSRLPLVHMQDI